MEALVRSEPSAPSPSLASEVCEPSSDIFATFEADVVGYDPFAGDFGGSDDRLFCDKMVTAAKAHEDCHTCGGGIAKGERHRYSSQKFDGELMAFRWCWACCTAMARVWCDPAHDSDRPHLEIEEREGLRWASATFDGSRHPETSDGEGEAKPNPTEP